MKRMTICFTLMVMVSIFTGCKPEGTKIPHHTAPPLSTSTPDSLIEMVTFTTSDDIQLAGTLFGDGDVAVVLAHQGTEGADQTTWHEFGALLAEQGYTALTFDFRGIGKSGGTPDRSKLDTDVLSALQFLHDEDHEKIFCVGASMGGTTCIQTAINGYQLAGLVALGSAMITGYGVNDLKVSQDELGLLSLPKLFISAENDIDLVVNDTTRMYENSPEPKALHFLPGSAHGTDLFNTDAGDELTTILLEFLKNAPELPVELGESGSE